MELVVFDVHIIAVLFSLLHGMKHTMAMSIRVVQNYEFWYLSLISILLNEINNIASS